MAEPSPLNDDDSFDGFPLKWSELDPTQIRREPPAPPLFRYQPQRVRMLLPFGQRMSSFASQFVSGGLMTEEGFQELAEMVLVPAGAAGEQDDGTIRARLENQAVNPRGEFAAVEGFTFYAMFEGAGRQIFDFPARLTELFHQTDIDDVPGDRLKLPYSTVYFSFGPQDGMEIQPGWTLDGAYVNLTEGGPLQICVTAAPADVGRYRRYGEGYEPFYVQGIAPGDLSKTLGDAVEDVLAAKMARLQKERAQGMGPDVPRQSVRPDLGMIIEDASSRNAAAVLGDIERRHGIYKKMLRLVVNAMIYVTAYPEDAPAEWGPETPERLLNQVQKGTSWKQTRNATSKLLSMGYTAVHMCGRQLLQTQDERGSGGRAVPAGRHLTWRKGHWRDQAYGPGYSLHRLRWYMPQLVLAVGDGVADGPPGHIYLVE